MKYNKNIERLLKLKIPFDGNGNQLMEYSQYVYPKQKYGFGYIGDFNKIQKTSELILKDNYIFEDTLIFLHSRKNHIIFKRKTTGTKVMMHTFAFNSVAPLLKNGRVKGSFIFYRKGQVFGCKLINTLL